jgi:hypothetical protein
MRTLFFVLIIFLSVNHLFAQRKDVQVFSATAIVGMNASQIDGDATAGYNKIGLNVGAKAGIYLAEKWEIDFEILYSQQGSQTTLVKGIPRRYYCNLDYIEVPLLVHFKDWKVTNSDNKSYHRFHFGAGASYNRLMGGKVLNDGILEFQGLESLTNQGNFRKNHFYLIGDINFFFTKNWGVNLRYQRAPMNIRTNTYFNPYMIVFRALYRF